MKSSFIPDRIYPTTEYRENATPGLACLFPVTSSKHNELPIKKNSNIVTLMQMAARLLSLPCPAFIFCNAPHMVSLKEIYGYLSASDN
jgi:hypothetical protein